MATSVNGSAPAMLEGYNARRIAKGQPPITADAFYEILDRAERTELELAELACKRVLTRLQLLPEGPAAQIKASGQAAHPTTPTRLRTRHSRWQEEHVSGRGDPLPVKNERFLTSTIPDGVRVDGGHEAAPSKQFSLWAHYSYRIDRARARGDAAALLRLAACASRDYEVATGKRPGYHANHEAAVTELLRDCVGVPSVEAAWYLGAPLKWVKQQRILNRRDPELGERLPPRSERQARIFALKDEGKTQVEIAEAVGLTQQRVQQILAGK